MWAIEFGPPAGGAALRTWKLAESRQPGIFAQLVTVPLFNEHHVLTQVAGHRMNVIKALPPLVIEDEDLAQFSDSLDTFLASLERRLTRAMARFGLGVAR